MAKHASHKHKHTQTDKHIHNFSNYSIESYVICFCLLYFGLSSIILLDSSLSADHRQRKEKYEKFELLRYEQALHNHHNHRHHCRGSHVSQKILLIVLYFSDSHLKCFRLCSAINVSNHDGGKKPDAHSK